MEDNTRAAVHGAIANVFGYPQEQITDLTCAFDVPGWDSLSNAFVIVEIEDALGFTLPLDRILTAQNVGEMVAIIVAVKDEKGGFTS